MFWLLSAVDAEIQLDEAGGPALHVKHRALVKAPNEWLARRAASHQYLQVDPITWLNPALSYAAELDVAKEETVLVQCPVAWTESPSMGTIFLDPESEDKV